MESRADFMGQAFHGTVENQSSLAMSHQNFKRLSTFMDDFDWQFVYSIDVC
jgi:hypothetical protein